MKKHTLSKLVLLGIGSTFTVAAWASTPTTSWNLGTGAPSTGVSAIRFPLEFNSTPDAKGLYFAFYVPLQGGSRPYTGFQPEAPVVAGKHQFQLIFSSFSAGATSTDANCSSGADGGSGVSCATRANLDLNVMYSNRIEVTIGNNNIDSYSADLYNDISNTKVTHIGSFSLPHTSGGYVNTSAPNGGGGFIEPYVSAGCTQNLAVTYGKPSGSVDGTTYTGAATTVATPSSGSCVSTSSTSTAEGNAVMVTGLGQ